MELLHPGKQLQERDCLNPAALSSALKLFLLEAREKLVQPTGFGI